MQENSNKAIAVNTIVLYSQLIITIVAGLLSTRFALKGLGVDDFGLFSVISSILAIASIINSIMLSTSNRFIAVAIGRGNMNEVNMQFNVNLLIHIIIAVLTLLFSIIIGHWYIINYVNYLGDINNVKVLFDITIIGTVVSIIGVPYNGVMTARERFLCFSIVVSVSNLLKIPLSYYLQFWTGSKLYFYGSGLAFLTAAPTFIYVFYCYLEFPKIVRIRLVKDWNKYKQMLMFSFWVGYGAIAYIAKSSGSALIVNLFFTTAINTALGVASTVNIALGNFATNVTKAISPQITKCYAAGNKERSEMLVCLASKASFMITFLISSPLLIAPDYIFELWLDVVPAYAITFAILMIVDTLIDVLNAGVSDIIMASGNIKWYQLVDQTLKILSVIAGYFTLKAGASAYYLYVVYIIYSFISTAVKQILLNKIISFNTMKIVKYSFFPSFLVAILFLPLVSLRNFGMHPILLIFFNLVYVSMMILLIGLTHNERNYLKNYYKCLKTFLIKN